jgi:transcriptional regulator with XRE-family HTH domain
VNSAGEFEAVENAIGSRIRSQRNQLGLTQEELSGLAGIDRKHISSIEAGKVDPRTSTVFKIATALGIPASQLVEGLVWVSNEHGVGHLMMQRIS